LTSPRTRLGKDPIRTLLVAGCLSLGFYAALSFLSHRDPSLSVFAVLYVGAFLLFCGSAYLTWTSPSVRDGPLLAVIAVFAILFRLAALGGKPLFEDDLHRYLWDGKVWASGINPYFYSPDSYFLEDLRDENWNGINYKDVPTIYPPLAQMFFRASWHVAPNSQAAFKGLLLLFDLGVIAVLLALLPRLGQPRHRVLLYAWNPLVIKEISNSGHLDVIAVFFVVLCCFFSVLGRRLFSATALALAILVKLFPLVLLPALIRHFRVRDFLLLAGILVAGYLPFWDAQELLFTGLGTYAAQWEFNDSGFVLLSFLFGPVTGSPGTWAKAIVAIGLLFLGLGLSRTAAASTIGRARAFFLLIGALLIFSPTVDTWYLVWIVPFLCFFRLRSWLLLTGTALAAYGYLWQGEDFWWIRALEYGPFYVVLAIEILPSIRSGLNWHRFPRRPERNPRTKEAEMRSKAYLAPGARGRAALRPGPSRTVGGLAMLALLGLGAEPALAGGPWTLEKGHGYVNYSVVGSRFNSFELFDGTVTTSTNNTRNLDIAVGIEYGLTDRLTLAGTIPYDFAATEGSANNTHQSLSDGRFAARFKIIEGVGVGFGAKIPLSNYPVNTLGALGYGQTDLDFSLLLGRTFHIASQPTWADVELTYRARLGDYRSSTFNGVSKPSDVLAAYGEFGILATKKLSLRVFGFGTDPTSPFGLASPDFRALQAQIGTPPFPRMSQTYIKVGGGASYQVADRVDVGIAWVDTVLHHSTTIDQHFELRVGFQF